LNVNAQRRGVPNLQEYDFEPFHFGFLLGINQMGFSVLQDWNSFNSQDSRPRTPYEAYKIDAPGVLLSYLKSVLPSTSTLFTIGLVGSLRLTEDFSLRITPSLTFGDRSLIYTLNDKDPISPATFEITKKVSSTVIAVPILLRYSGARIQNAQPFIEAGFNYLYNIKTSTNTSGVNFSTNQPLAFLAGYDDTETYNINLHKSDINGVIGLGFDFYFDWFKMSVEGTMSYGFKDILDRTKVNLNTVDLNSRDYTMYQYGITSLKSKVFQISVTFE
jgi:hypothetical protein